ncbi:MAG: ATP synthase subunit I [Firmicutes bacterium]|nr:ATP synthase subunit I [Bacillota bacterium]
MEQPRPAGKPWIPTIAIAALFLVFRNQPLWAGFWIGLLVGVVNWYGLANAAHKAVWLTKEQAQRYMLLNYMVRYGLRFVVLAIALICYELNPVTLLVGLTVPTVVAVFSYRVKTR